MIIKDTPTSKGQVRLEIYKLTRWQRFVSRVIEFFGYDEFPYIRSNGIFIDDTGFVPNIIVNGGKALQAARVGGLTGAAVTYVALGTSNTAVAVAQTALGSEISTLGLSRANVTPTQVTTTTANDTLQLQKSFSVSGTITVEEIGLFNAASGPTMLNRALTGSKAVDNGDTILATYQLIYS